jgi:hypothetical protein
MSVYELLIQSDFQSAVVAVLRNGRCWPCPCTGMSKQTGLCALLAASGRLPSLTHAAFFFVYGVFCFGEEDRIRGRIISVLYVDLCPIRYRDLNKITIDTDQQLL